MNSKHMQVIGLCRFSYPATGGFQIKHETILEREQFLYASERMEERFRTFEAFTIPSITAQTDEDFTFIVVVGDSLPKAHYERLMDNLSGLDQVVVQKHPTGNHRDVMKQAINSVREQRNVPCLQFRLDDDDCVNVKFVELLRKAAQKSNPFIKQYRFVGIDFTHGHKARLSRRGISAIPTSQTQWACALAVSIPVDAPQSIFNFTHSRLSQHMPVIALPNEDMFIRGYGDYNDSQQRNGKVPIILPLVDSEGEQHFKNEFNVDADLVRNLWRC